MVGYPTVNSNSFVRILKFLIILFTIPALFINLGLLPLISDEPTRAVVTLEMLISGDFIHPTINGELYLNKPPLFNWIQCSFITLTGSADEWVFRLPAVLSLLAFGFVIYLVSGKHLKSYAFAAAMGFVVSGRILFWDSFMGLIDITYSMVVFISFVWMIHFERKRKYLLLFVGSYFLASAGFLMKGLPSIAFQALSLNALLVYKHKEKEIFSVKHLAGILVFVIITGGYYFLYSVEHPVNDLIYRLFHESNRLQATNSSNGWLHLLQFPLKYLFEFAPLTILVFLLLSRKIKQRTFDEPYYRILLLLFLVNIIIYWLSADMRSRYLFMLVPLLGIILLKAYSVAEEDGNKAYRIIKVVVLSASFIIALSVFVYPVWFETNHFRNVWLYCSLLFIAAMVFWALSFFNRKIVLLSLIFSLLAARIAFNLFNLPARYNSYPDKDYRDGEIKAARLSASHPLYILDDTPVNHDLSFYITRERGEILRRTTALSEPDAFYITNEENLDIFAVNNKNYRVHHIFRIKLDETRLFLVTIK